MTQDAALSSRHESHVAVSTRGISELKSKDGPSGSTNCLLCIVLNVVVVKAVSIWGMRWGGCARGSEVFILRQSAERDTQEGAKYEAR